MRFMLDTNACIAVIKRQSSHVCQRMRSHLEQSCISSLTLAELRFGAEKSANSSANHAAIDLFLSPLQIELFDEPAAYVYGLVRARLQRLGQPIDPLDTLIGAHALALNLILVTNNTREFARIEGLKVEDWSA